MQQGTHEWHMARLGNITSSEFCSVMTPPKAKSARWSQTALSYSDRLIGEILTQRYVDCAKTAPIEWGNHHEPIARDAYCEKHQCCVEEVGFVQMERRIGGSPDGLVGDDGGIEIKCPMNPHNHLRVLESLEVPSEYKWQVIGNMLVTDREWYDFVSFHPWFPPQLQLVVIRVFRSVEEQLRLLDELRAFRSMIDERLGNIHAMMTGGHDGN